LAGGAGARRRRGAWLCRGLRCRDADASESPCVHGVGAIRGRFTGIGTSAGCLRHCAWRGPAEAGHYEERDRYSPGAGPSEGRRDGCGHDALRRSDRPVGRAVVAGGGAGVRRWEGCRTDTRHDPRFGARQPPRPLVARWLHDDRAACVDHFRSTLTIDDRPIGTTADRKERSVTVRGCWSLVLGPSVVPGPWWGGRVPGTEDQRRIEDQERRTKD